MLTTTTKKKNRNIKQKVKTRVTNFTNMRMRMKMSTTMKTLKISQRRCTWPVAPENEEPELIEVRVGPIDSQLP